MEQLFSQWGPASPLFWVRALWAISIFIGVAWIASLSRRGTQRSLQRIRAHPNAILFFGLVAQYGVVAFGLVITLAILGVELSALAAVLGFGTVALTLSLQDIARNFIAGLYLLIERPFQVGDTIEVGGQKGVIENVELRTTIMRNADGDRVIVPNTVMFTSVVIQKKTKERV